MKSSNYLTTLFMLCLIVSICYNGNGQKSAHKFIDELKKERDVYAVTLPGWVIRSGLNMAIDDDIKEKEGYRDIAKGIKKMRFAFADRGDIVTNDHVQKLIKLSHEKDGMTTYAKVKEKGNKINILVKEEGDRIKSLVILTQTDEEFAIVNLKTNISLTDLENARFSFNENKE